MSNVTNAASEKLISTIAVLPDQVLLEQTGMLARHEQALQLSVLDHLREIEARRLYLRLGYSSLFDYVVTESIYRYCNGLLVAHISRYCFGNPLVVSDHSLTRFGIAPGRARNWSRPRT